MANLVAVCRVENHQFRRRQLPLVVDDSLTVLFAYLRNITCSMWGVMLFNASNACNARMLYVKGTADVVAGVY